MENDISKVILDISNATTRVRGLQEILNNINNLIYQKSDTISKIENEIVKRNATIEKKQGTIDHLNKKIHALLNKNGVCAFLFSSSFNEILPNSTKHFSEQYLGFFSL